MALPDLMDLIRHDPRRSMVIRAVAGTPGSAMPDVETLWRKAVFTAESAGTPLSGKFSLEDLLERRKVIALVDDGSGENLPESGAPADSAVKTAFRHNVSTSGKAEPGVPDRKSVV